MDTPLIVGIIVGTVLLPIYLIVGMIWLNKVEKRKKEETFAPHGSEMEQDDFQG